MLLLYKSAICPSCGKPHDLVVEESGTALLLKMHDFICPANGQRTAWQPNVFAHPIQQLPNQAIRLLPHVNTVSTQPGLSSNRR